MTSRHCCSLSKLVVLGTLGRLVWLLVRLSKMVAFVGITGTAVVLKRPQTAVRHVFRPSLLPSVGATDTGTAAAASAAANSCSWHKRHPENRTVAAAAYKAGAMLHSWPPSSADPGALYPIPGSFQLSKPGQLFVTQPEAWDPESGWSIVPEGIEDAEQNAYKAGSEAPGPLDQLLENIHKQLSFTLENTEGWPFKKAQYVPSGVGDPEHTLIIGAAPGTWTAAVRFRRPVANTSSRDQLSTASSTSSFDEGSSNCDYIVSSSRTFEAEAEAAEAEAEGEANKVASLVLTHASVTAAENLDNTLFWALSGTVCNKDSYFRYGDASVHVVDASALLDDEDASPMNTSSLDTEDERLDFERFPKSFFYSRTPYEVFEMSSIVSKVGPISVYPQGLILINKAPRFKEFYTYCPVSKHLHQVVIQPVSSDPVNG